MIGMRNQLIELIFLYLTGLALSDLQMAGFMFAIM